MWTPDWEISCSAYQKHHIAFGWAPIKKDQVIKNESRCKHFYWNGAGLSCENRKQKHLIQCFTLQALDPKIFDKMALSALGSFVTFGNLVAFGRAILYAKSYW